MRTVFRLYSSSERNEQSPRDPRKLGCVFMCFCRAMQNVNTVLCR